MTFFAINRSADEALEVDLAIEHFGDARSVEHTLIKHDDLRAKNTEKMPNNVVPTRTDGARKSQGGLALILPPLSYSMIRVQL